MKRRLMFGGKKKLFTKRFYPAGDYTWVVPPGCTEVDVFLVGAGGGAGAVVFSTHNGSHGIAGGDGTVLIRYRAWRE